MLFKAAFTVMFAAIIWLLWRAWQTTELRDLIIQAFRTTMRITAMVAFIVIGATSFSITFQGVDGNRWVEHLMSSLPGGVWGFLIVVNLFVFFLAFFLDFFEIAFIIVPMLAPVAQKLLTPVVGADAALIWFGVMLCVNMQTSFLHPPFGFALFYLRSVAPNEDYKDKLTGRLISKVTTGEIYWGAVPFVLIQIAMVGLIIAFPGLVSRDLAKEGTIDTDKAFQEMRIQQKATDQADTAASVPAAAASAPVAAPTEKDDPMRGLLDEIKKEQGATKP